MARFPYYRAPKVTANFLQLLCNIDVHVGETSFFSIVIERCLLPTYNTLSHVCVITKTIKQCNSKTRCTTALVFEETTFWWMGSRRIKSNGEQSDNCDTEQKKLVKYSYEPTVVERTPLNRPWLNGPL